MVFMIILWIYSLALLIPSIAVTVRRLHDLGKGGGWIFISAIPILGGIILLILMICKGEPQTNRFGEPIQ
ncbi:Inner membrane protein yhaI [Chlamydia trachomatis]|nr:Inner membrane protein yhaI [Chlamydia trachomatis]